MKVLVLAGGRGSRLWPLSKKALPKQFLTLPFQDGTLFQKTLKRFLSFVPKKDIWVVTHQDYEDIARSQMEEIESELSSQIILEPERKNTAPAIALALKFLQEKGLEPEDIILTTPSDHLMLEEGRLADSFSIAGNLAQEGWFVLLGVKPHKPEIGYGYIKMKEKEFFRVAAFIEKPPLEKAEEFLKDDTYLWNSGMCLFKQETFWQEMQKESSAIGSLANYSYKETLGLFSNLPSLSLDYALLEKSQKLAVVPLDLFWSDIGSWDSIFDISQKDHNSNVKMGNILEVNTKNCLIIGGKRLISTIGLEDIVIVETEEALFIGKRGETQKVGIMVE